MSTLNNGVFIIESNYFKKEQAGDLEGVLLKELLQLIGVQCQYYYIRTKDELKFLLKEFQESNLKYLHISCHGDENGIALTLDEDISLKELASFLGTKLQKRRLFISACSITNGKIDKEFKNTGLRSIIGTNHKVDFYDAAVFWASFYRFIFKLEKGDKDIEKKPIYNDLIADTIKRLSKVFGVYVTFFVKLKNNNGYRIEIKTDPDQ